MDGAQSVPTLTARLQSTPSLSKASTRLEKTLFAVVVFVMGTISTNSPVTVKDASTPHVPGPPPSDGEGGASQAAAPAACARISELEDDLVGWPSASTGSGEVTGGNLRRSRPEGVHVRQQTRRKEVHIGQQTQPEEATHTPRPAIPSTPRPAIPSTPRPAIPSTPRPAIPSTPRPPTPSTPRPATPSTPRPATPATIRPLTPSTLRTPTTTRPPATPPPLTPATPSPLTPSPPLPQPANPHSTNKSSSGHCLVRQVGLNQEQLMASDQTTSNGSPAISSLRQAGPPFAMSIGPIHQQLLAKTGRSSGSCGPASPLGNQVTPSSLVCVLPKGSSLPGNSLFANASLSPPTQPVTLKPATSRQVVHPPPSSMNVEVHRASPAIQPKHCLNIQTKALQRSPKPSLRPNSLALHTMEAAMQQQTAVLNPTFPVDAPVRNVVLPPWASSPMTGQTQPAQPRLHNPTSVHVMTQASTLSVPQPVVPAKRRFILPGHLASVVSGHQPLPAACAGAGLTLGLPRQPAATHIVDHRDPSGQLNANKPSTAQTLTGQSTAWHRTSFGQVSATPGRQPVVGGGRAGVLSGHGQLASSALLRVPTHPDADFPRSRSSEHCVRSVVQPVLLPNRITVPGDTGPTEQPVTLQQLSAISSGSFDVQPQASRNAKLTPGLGLLHARAPPPYCPHAPAQLQGSWHPPPLSVTPPQTGNTLGENTGQCISQLEGRDTLICDQLLMFQQKEQKQQLLYRQVLKMQQERGLCLTSSSRPPVSSAAVPVITSGGSGAAVQAKTNLVPANAVPMEPENDTVTPRPQSSLFLPVLASQFEEPAGSLKQSVETIQNRDNLLLERFCKDQTSVMQPDCNAPFHSFEDTVLSLLPYHVCEGTMPSSVDFNKVDEEFQVASTNLLKQTQAMQNKYHMLLLEESRRTKSSAEMVMINRMFIQEEKVAFLEARQLARDSPDAYISSVFQPDIDNSPPSSARLLVAPNTLPSTKQLAAPELVIRQARSWSLDTGARALPAGEDPVVSSPPSPPKIYTVRSKSGLKLKIKQEAGYNQVVHNTEFDHPPVGPVKQLSGTRGCTPSPFNHSNRVCNCTTPSLAERRLLERLGTRDLSKQRLHLAKGKLNHPCCCSPVLVPDPTRTYLPLDSAANRLGDDQKVSHSCCPLGTGARQLTSDSRNASSSLPFRTRGRPGGRWGNHTSNEVEDTIARGLMEVDSICHLPWELSLPRPKRRRSESEENGSFSSDSPQDNALNQHLQSAINSILDLQRLQTSEEEPPELAELSTPPCSPSPSSGDFMQQEHESGVLGAETSTLGEVVNSI
ncbi:uncharacterized protein LOC144597725 [Rhinoraja longicauda]